jgi:Cellulase (glycosyl hydrolase family 5)
VVDENGSAVHLRGITVAGLDTLRPAPGQALADALALGDASLSVLVDRWGANLVRIPFTSRAVLSGTPSLSASDLLAGLDDLIVTISSAGCYVLLALEPSTVVVNGLPSDDDYVCWKSLAIRYKDEPAVLYELFAANSSLAHNWLGVAQALIGTVRREHTASLLFVSNGAATADLSGFPLRFTTGELVHNLVYTIRMTPQLLNTVDRAQLQSLTQRCPVFVSQWSGSGTDLGRSSELAADMMERYGVGWAAANWNAEPRIVIDAGTSQFVPTRWGLLVQRALALPVRARLARFGGTENSPAGP